MTTQTISNKLYDEGLRKYMINIYNHMTAGLMVSGITAFFIYTTGLIPILMSGILGIFFIFAPLLMLFGLLAFSNKISVVGMTIFYYTFVMVFGVSLSILFEVYTASSMIQVFFITAATFASASIYGYTTKRDLTNFGAFLFMGLIGIIIASVVNLFMASSAMAFAISILAVLIFTGLTAYDTQTAKSSYYQIQDKTESGKFAVMMAMNLYLNFINLFIHLLQLLGESK